MKQFRPLKHKTPIRKKKSRGGSIKDKTLDDACRAVVFARDGHRCQLCGKNYYLQWSHVRSSRYKVTRWNPRNSKCLCAGCHRFKWHDPPPGFDPLGWWRDLHPGWLDEIDALLLYRAGKPKPKLDRYAILATLEAQLRAYGPSDSGTGSSS